MEYGVPSSLETPRGTITFNDFAAASHFRLTSLEVVKPLRIPLEARPQADGAIIGRSFHAGLQLVAQGQIVPAGGSESIRATMLDQIRSYPDSLRDADGIFRHTPSGKAARRAAVRLLDDVSTRGELVKEFQLALVSSEPLFFSDLQSSLDTSAIVAGGGGALVLPTMLPFSFGDYTSGGTVDVTNNGNEPSPPLVRIYGAITSPVLRNTTTGKALSLTGLSLSDGDYVEIDFARETLLLNGSALSSLLHTVDIATSEFWRLEPGLNTIRLSAASFGAGGKATIFWRDAWA